MLSLRRISVFGLGEQSAKGSVYKNHEHDEVIMTKLSDEEKKAIGEIRPSLVATASKTGKSNVSAKARSGF
jgi:hypothetical protein